MRSRRIGTHHVPPQLDEPVVVIDVLRAFTTAPWILEGGASALMLASSPTDALTLKRRLGPTAIAVTDGTLSPGFDLGNSPAQAKQHVLTGLPVVQTTANGTVGVHAVRHAPLVLCASLVTATATARAVLDSGTDRVTYVVTGDDGTADEDVACADLIHALVTQNEPPTDTVDRVRSSPAAAGLRAAIAAGSPGVNEDDIALACEIDRFDFALAASQRDGHVEVDPTGDRRRWGS